MWRMRDVEMMKDGNRDIFEGYLWENEMDEKGVSRILARGRWKRIGKM